MTENNSCPFCSLPASRIIDSNRIGVVIRDAYPVSPGHTLVIPRRHVSSFFGITETERTGLMDLVVRAQALLQPEYAPDGYNIGINDGANAGQTVPHLHLHLIPRFAGDVSDPRGGVRWVIPDKAKYWP